jgi:replicative DNA helicase
MNETRVMPSCNEVECSVLGSMLLEQNAVYIVSRILKADSFYKIAHQIIFRGLVGLYEKDVHIDLISLTQELRRSGELDDVGGEYYLTELTNKVTSAANVEYQAHIVFEHAIKRQIILSTSEINDSAYSEMSDIFELIESVQRLDIETMGRINDCKTHDKLTILNDYVAYIQSKNNKKKFPTGFPTLDRMLKGGLPTGGYSILGGDAGSGKTSIMLACALHMAQKGYNVFFIEGEMPSNEIYERLNGIWTGIDIDEIVRCDRYDELTKPFVSMMHKIPFTLVKNYNRTIESLVSDIKQAVYKKADIIFIDYLQVFAPREKAENEFSAIKIVSETIRSLSLKNPIHICVASAYTREGKFYGSKLLDNDATQLLRLNYDRDDDSKKISETITPVREITLEVEKNRSGARGDFPIRYYLDSQKMVEIDQSGNIAPPDTENNYDEPEQPRQLETPF